MKKSLLAIALVTLGACVSSAQTPAPKTMPTPDVVGKSWIAKVDPAIDPRQAPRLEFLPDGRLSGYTGCNTLSGTWTAAGDSLQLGQLVMTKRACVGPGADVEKRFLEAVNTKSRLTMEGERLVAKSEGGSLMEFAADNTGR